MPPRKTTAKKSGSKKTGTKKTIAKKTAKRTRKQPTMTRAHKAALARGRTESSSVRRYLEALEANRPKPGRPRTPQSVEGELRRIEQQLVDADPLGRLNLLQRRRDLRSAVEGQRQKADLGALERGFAKAAKAYGDRRGIVYATWREAGVPPSVLAKARISRGGAG